jgi:hypothetical protein
MNRPLLIATAAAFLGAAASNAQNAFQQNGWVRTAGNTTVIHSNPMDGQTGPILGRPVSANEVHTAVQTLSDGSHIRSTETDSFYRDSRGRMRVETETGIMIYDPDAGMTYDLTKRNHTYAKHSDSQGTTVTIAAAAHFSSVHSSSGNHKAEAPKAGGPVTEDLSPQVVNGVSARGTRVTSTIPAGSIGNDQDLKVVNERWTSDDLKLLIRSSNSDPRFGVSTYELTNIVQGEPDFSLFQLPSDYVEETHNAAHKKD